MPALILTYFIGRRNLNRPSSTKLCIPCKIYNVFKRNYPNHLPKITEALAKNKAPINPANSAGAVASNTPSSAAGHSNTPSACSATQKQNPNPVHSPQTTQSTAYAKFKENNNYPDLLPKTSEEFIGQNGIFSPTQHKYQQTGTSFFAKKHMPVSASPTPLLITDGTHPRDSHFSQNPLSVPSNAVIVYTTPPNKKKHLEVETPSVILIPKSLIQPEVPKLNALTETQLAHKVLNEAHKFKSLSSGEKYTPTVHADSTASNFTRQQIIDFFRERGLIAYMLEDEPNGVVKLLVISGDYILVGVRQHDHKLTAQGAAYHNKVIPQRYINAPEKNFPADLNTHGLKPHIIVVKQNGADNVADTSSYLHPQIGYPFGDYYFIADGLTSTKNKGQILLHLTQYKDYALQKEKGVLDKDIIPGEKKQFVMSKSYLQYIHKDSVAIVKWSEEYLAYIEQQDYFKQTLYKLKPYSYVPFDDFGVSKEEALSMIKDMDYNCGKSQKHPSAIGANKMSNKVVKSAKNTNDDNEF